MNKKRFIVLSMALVMALAASAQIKRVAILETIDKENKVPYAIEVMVRSNLTKVISNTAGYEGYDRVNISQIMDEHDFERTGLVNEEQIRRLGEISGADYILVSEAVKFDESNIFVTAKILNVESAKTESSENALMGMSAPDIQHGCESLANRLLGLSDPMAQDKLAAVPEKKVEEKQPVETPDDPKISKISSGLGKLTSKTPVEQKVADGRLGNVVTFPDGTMGMVFYIGPDGRGLAVSLTEGEEPWDNSGRTNDVVGLMNFEDEEESMVFGSGEGFTRVICSSLGDQGRAAFWCRLQGDGWYLPSSGEFNTLTNALKENPSLSKSLANAGGGEISGWYWSSSEHDKKEAWNVSGGGWTSTEKKKEKNKVRAIRAFTE